jgi:hypothetical protein
MKKAPVATSQANEYDVKEHKSSVAKDALSEIKDKLK